MQNEHIPKGTLVRYVGNNTGNFENTDLIGSEGKTLAELVISGRMSNVDVVFEDTIHGPRFLGVMRMNLEIIGDGGEDELLPAVSGDETFSDAHGDSLTIETGNEGDTDLIWITAKDKHGEALLEFSDRDAVLDLASHLLRVGLAMNKE